MKKIIFGGVPGRYKANLHSHTTISDGRLTPRESRDAYRDHGYSVVCFSDHDLMRPHSDLNEPGFLMITGYELEINKKIEGKTFNFWKSLHMNVFSPVPEENRNICATGNDARWLSPDGSKDVTVYLRGEPYVKTFDTECFNHVIAEAKKYGLLVTLNHPAWSLLEPEDYLGISGDLFAVEIHNGSCECTGFHDDDTYVWDLLLRQGKRVFGTGSDDNHNARGREIGNPNCDSFVAYDVIAAPSLTYDNIFEGLKNGNFYASNGAEIDEVYYEDGKIVVDCPPARSISLISDLRANRRLNAFPDNPLTHAEFALPTIGNYVRIEVENFEGKRAYSQPLWFEDIKEDLA